MFKFDQTTYTPGIYTPSIHIKIQFLLLFAVLKYKLSSHFTSCHFLWNQLKRTPPTRQSARSPFDSLYFHLHSAITLTRTTVRSHSAVDGARFICTDHLIYMQILNSFRAHLHSDWMFFSVWKQSSHTACPLTRDIEGVSGEYCNLGERKGAGNKEGGKCERWGAKVREQIDLGEGMNFSVHFSHAHLNSIQIPSKPLSVSFSP